MSADRAAPTTQAAADAVGWDTECRCGFRAAPPSPVDGDAAEEWERTHTEGPRKAWDQENLPPPGEGWERDLTRGDGGWERFDYHEEAYWRRPKRPVDGDARGRGDA